VIELLVILELVFEIYMVVLLEILENFFIHIIVPILVIQDIIFSLDTASRAVPAKINFINTHFKTFHNSAPDTHFNVNPADNYAETTIFQDN